MKPVDARPGLLAPSPPYPRPSRACTAVYSAPHDPSGAGLGVAGGWQGCLGNPNRAERLIVGVGAGGGRRAQTARATTN
jgi:hypothetical protein